MVFYVAQVFAYKQFSFFQFPVSSLWKTWSDVCRSSDTPSRCREPTRSTVGKAPPSATKSRSESWESLVLPMLLQSSCRWELIALFQMRSQVIDYSGGIIDVAGAHTDGSFPDPCLSPGVLANLEKAVWKVHGAQALEWELGHIIALLLIFQLIGAVT